MKRLIFGLSAALLIIVGCSRLPETYPQTTPYQLSTAQPVGTKPPWGDINDSGMFAESIHYVYDSKRNADCWLFRESIDCELRP